MAAKKSKKVEEPILPPSNLFGWLSIDEVANEISSSYHRDLLKGEFVCACRGDWDLQRLVVTRRMDNPYYFMMGIICRGYTAYFPYLSKEAVLDFITSDMKEKKVPSGIINDFEKILNNY